MKPYYHQIFGRFMLVFSALLLAGMCWAYRGEHAITAISAATLFLYWQQELHNTPQ